MRSPEEEDGENYAGIELDIAMEFQRKIQALRRLPRGARSHALRAAREARSYALKALQERRSMSRHSRHTALKQNEPAPG